MQTKNCLQTFSCSLVNELAAYNPRLYEALAENGRHKYNVSNLSLATLRLSSTDMSAVQDNSMLRGHLLDPKMGIYQFATLQVRKLYIYSLVR